jgi:hypothetical protein
VFIAIIVDSMSEAAEASKAIDGQTALDGEAGEMNERRNESTRLKEQIAKVERSIFVPTK